MNELSAKRDEYAPYSIAYFKSLKTTQSLLLEHEGPVKNMVCLTEVQTIGRGRNKRSWFSPYGGLTFSIKIPVNQTLLEFIPHLCALAVVLAVDETVPHEVGLLFGGDFVGFRCLHPLAV